MGHPLRRILGTPGPHGSNAPNGGAPMGGWGAMGGGAQGGGKDFFGKLKGCGGESLRRLFRLDFCIFDFFIKSMFEEFTKTVQSHF